MALLTSKGIKRKLTTYLVLVIELLRTIPGTAPVVAGLEQIVGIWGGAAIGHGAAAGTLNKEKIAGIVSIIYALIFAANFFPPLLPALPYLYKAAALLSAARVGKEVLE